MVLYLASQDWFLAKYNYKQRSEWLCADIDGERSDEYQRFHHCSHRKPNLMAAVLEKRVVVG